MALIFCDTVTPMGIPFNNEITWQDLTQSLVVQTCSPAVFSKSCVVTEAIGSLVLFNFSYVWPMYHPEYFLKDVRLAHQGWLVGQLHL